MASQGRQSNTRGGRGQRGGKPSRGEGSDVPSKLSISQFRKLEETQLEKLRKRFLPVGNRIASVRETMPIQAGFVVSEFEFYDSVQEEWITFSEASEILRKHMSAEEAKALEARSQARFGKPVSQLTQDQKGLAALSNRDYAARIAPAGSPASTGLFPFGAPGASGFGGPFPPFTSPFAASAASSSSSSSSSASQPTAAPPSQGEENKDADKGKASNTKGS